MSLNQSPVTNHKSQITIGITGQAGFMGTHLFNYLGLQENIERVPFKDEIFNNSEKLKNWVKQCDVIVHLAAMNRHNDPQVIYDTNIDLVKKLIEAFEATSSTPHVLFSSSTQEERDNLYGKSKKEGRELLIQWAQRNKAQFTGMIIPNVFGPFGHPYYNSVVATFCHQLTHNEQPEIQVDGELKLIYVGELVERIYSLITNHESPITSLPAVAGHQIKHTSTHKVSEILTLLESFKTNYFEKGIFPDLNDTFERNLFNTFVCYMDIENHFPVKLTQHSDDRGSFMETIKLNSGGQISFSTTKPGITRGNHFHIRKAERFAVIKGKAQIQLRKIGTKEVLNFDLDGSEPAYVDMPVWYTHNITNISDEEVYTIFWISEFFNSDDADTYFETV